MNTKNIKTSKNKGIALLFSIMLSMIFFTIAIGVLNIAVKELNFNSSAKDANNAFFAMDSGVECALYNDKANSIVFADPGASDISCLGTNFTLNGPFPNFSFTITGLGSDNNSCAIVTVSKTIDNADPANPVTITKIISKGYNLGGNGDCVLNVPSRVERVFEVNY